MSNIYEDYSELLIRYDDLFDVAEKYKKQLDIAVKECQQLKELLRECKPYVTRNVVFTIVNRAEVVDLEKNELLTKIDNAIGEK